MYILFCEPLIDGGIVYASFGVFSICLILGDLLIEVGCDKISHIFYANISEPSCCKADIWRM